MAKIAELTDASFAEQVFKSDGPILVEFWAPWCKPCMTLAPVIQEVAKELSDTVRVVRLNVDENPMATTLYGIRSIPSLILFYQENELVKITGNKSKQELLDLVHESLDRMNDKSDAR